MPKNTKQSQVPKATASGYLDPYSNLPEYEEILAGHPHLIGAAKDAEWYYNLRSASPRKWCTRCMGPKPKGPRGHPRDWRRARFAYELREAFEREGIPLDATERGPFVLTLRRVFASEVIQDMARVARECLSRPKGDEPSSWEMLFGKETAAKMVKGETVLIGEHNLPEPPHRRKKQPASGHLLRRRNGASKG